MHRTTRSRLAALACAAVLGTIAGCGGTPEHSGARTAGDPAGAGDNGRTGTPPEKEPDHRPFTLLATGDLLVHDSLIHQARADAGGSGYDFRPVLAGAEPLARSADLAICHMETVYGPDGGPFSGYPAFQTPPQLARAVKDTGYDSCSTASNHTLDAGHEGVERTLDAMDEAGLKHVGSARSAEEAGKPALMHAGGATVAQLAYTYATNGIPTPEDKPWLVDRIDAGSIVADARAARRDGADVVVVSMHWGTEWQEKPDELQRTVARELTASRTGGKRDIDLVIGTHAHVPQPYEKVNGTWVVHGLGDQIAGKMSDPRGTMGSAARFTFSPPAEKDGRWKVNKARFTPFLMKTSPRHSLIDLASEKSRTSGDAEQKRAYHTIRHAVFSRGAAGDGLRMTG